MLYCFLFFLLFKDKQSDMIFFAKKQICSSTNVVNKEWLLKLKNNKSFEYTVSELSTLNYKMGIKDDTLFFTGQWQFYDDTLFLYSASLREYCKAQVKYLIKENELFSLGANIDSLRSYRIQSLKFISKKGKLK
jgi:hypothetical protein